MPSNSSRHSPPPPSVDGDMRGVFSQKELSTEQPALAPTAIGDHTTDKHSNKKSKRKKSEKEAVVEGTKLENGYPKQDSESQATSAYVPKYSERRITKKMNAAKKKHRPVLDMAAWTRYDYARTFSSYRDTVLHTQTAIAWRHHHRQLSASHAHLYPHYLPPPSLASFSSPPSLPPPLANDERCPCVSIGIDRVHWKDMSVERFIEDYEKPYKPVAISGLSDHWPAVQKWTKAALSSGPYKNVLMKCGEDDDGYSVKVKLKYFMQYTHSQKDDSPLYIFDSAYDDHKIAKEILEDYEVPIYFREDLFRLVGEKRRPPYRWWLVGPERSGTSLHIDPLGTSAWNTLIHGLKYWVLFKPGCPKDQVKGEALRKKGEDGEAITWFREVLPRIKEEEAKKPGGPTLGMVEFLQYPGETVFIPGGWWHAVLNLEDSYAVTQNYAGSVNFPIVWQKTRVGRKHMAKRWLDALEEHYPELAKQAHQLNARDNFTFVFSDKSKKKKDKEKKKDKNREKSSMMSRKRSAEREEEGMMGSKQRRMA